MIERKNCFLKKCVLFISNDFNFFLDLTSNFEENKHIYKVMYKNKDEFFLSKFTDQVDVIVFDNTFDDLNILTMNLNEFNNNLNIPIIVVENKIRVDISHYNYTNIYAVIHRPINLQLLFISINLCINYIYLNNKITFEKGFHFDMKLELLFKDKEIINLTKIETKLIVFLLKNVNTLVEYEKISEQIWGKKNFSIFSLRNFIKSIRLKTYDTFLINVSNRGYKINSL